MTMGHRWGFIFFTQGNTIVAAEQEQFRPVNSRKYFSAPHNCIFILEPDRLSCQPPASYLALILISIFLP